MTLETGGVRPGKLNTIVYILFGLQLLFTLFSNRFYSFIAYIDNNDSSSGSMAGLISIVAAIAAVVCVIWFGRRHSLVLMFLSVELISILYQLCLHPSQILRPTNLIYTVVVSVLTVLFLVKLPPVEHGEPAGKTEQESVKLSSGSNHDSGPVVTAKLSMIMLYILAAVPVLYNIYSKSGGYEFTLLVSPYLKLSYFFVILSVIYLFITNTYLQDHLKAILTLIVVFTLLKFVLPLLYFVPGINYITFYAGYYLVYILLAVLIIAPVYTLLRGRRLPLLSRLADRISF